MHVVRIPDPVICNNVYSRCVPTGYVAGYANCQFLRFKSPTDYHIFLIQNINKVNSIVNTTVIRVFYY